MARRFYAIGTYAPTAPHPATTAIAKAILRIVAAQRVDGTWGGPDTLDKFISTCHCVMTLLAAGVSPDGPVLAPPIKFLREMDTDRQTTFFYRAGPLLNLPDATDIVNHDIRHLAKTQARAGGNPSYPAPFFLLKVLRFSTPSRVDSQEFRETLAWIIDDWDERTCWSDRTSITSMGLALIADLDSVSDSIKARSMQYLLDHFSSEGSRPYFHPNVIDDAFTVYNIFERWEVLELALPPDLREACSACAEGLVGPLESYVDSPPPFGGAVDSPEYGLAVLARALMAYQSATRRGFDNDLASAIASARIEDVRRQLGGLVSLEGFWGPVNPHDGGYAFVLMPFSPPRTTEIYEEYVKAPLMAQLGVECRRADDIYRSRAIMDDVWEAINGATFIIADLTDRNPNVFYELGLAHVLGKPVILIAERLGDVPFDLRGIRTIIYGDSPRSWRQLSDQIVKYAKEYK